jgi:hypothetical protein
MVDEIPKTESWIGKEYHKKKNDHIEEGEKRKEYEEEYSNGTVDD